MINIKKLKRPNKRSGYALPPKGQTTVRGMDIVNMNDFTVYIDKYTPRRKKK